MNRRRLIGWVLVPLGALAIVLSWMNCGYYSPSFAPADYYWMGLWNGVILLLGSLMVIFGWILLRKKKGG